MNSLEELIIAIQNQHSTQWRTYAMRWLIDQLNKIDKSGAATLDEGETPALPEHLLHELDEAWQAEESIVAELSAAIQADGLMVANPDALKQSLKDVANHLREIDLPVPQKLHEAYEEAIEVTLAERVLDTNYKDVLRFNKYLREYLYRNVEEMTQWHMAKIIDTCIAKLF